MLFKILFYQEEDGTVPLLDWLDGFKEPRLVAKCLAKIERLRELGHRLRRPEADYLRDGIYELRIGFRGVNYRLLYFFHEKSVIVISHGLTKEGKVPPKEIDRAIERKRRFVQDPKHHTYQES